MIDYSRLPTGFQVHESFDEMVSRRAEIHEAWSAYQSYEKSLLHSEVMRLPGFCAWCDRPSSFDFQDLRGSTVPNWRESLACAHCGLINRWRAALHVFSSIFSEDAGSPIYLTEQVSPLFRAFRKRFPSAIGSEYVNGQSKCGEAAWWRFRRVRHEDSTQLSFPSANFGAVLTFDVLEHIPDYTAALREFARVLRPDGLLLLTVPFIFNNRNTQIRAQVRADGSLEHLLSPVYHGDPLNGQGVLCYQDFGWDLLDEMTGAGFASVRLITAWRPHFGYLGSHQAFFAASR